MDGEGRGRPRAGVEPTQLLRTGARMIRLVAGTTPTGAWCSHHYAPRMPTFAQCIDLVDDAARIAEYRRLHQRIWPEVASGLRGLGLSNMRIWISGTRLFMTYDAADGFDPARDYQRYAEEPRVKEWESLMRTFQRRAPAAHDGEWWSVMECVFEMDAPP